VKRNYSVIDEIKKPRRHRKHREAQRWLFKKHIGITCHKPVCQVVSRLFFFDMWNNYWKKTLWSSCLRGE